MFSNDGTRPDGAPDEPGRPRRTDRAGQPDENEQNERPVLLGYASAADTRTAGRVGAKRRVLGRLAEREGYALGDVFIDITADADLALTALIQAADLNDAAAIAVPTWADLGATSRDQHSLRRRIYAETGLRVLVAESIARTSSDCADGTPISDLIIVEPIPDPAARGGRERG